MPSSYPALQKKFMSDVTDGTDITEAILLKAGARIVNGVIYVPKDWKVEEVTYGEILDAKDFLCSEFDYSVIAYGETHKSCEPTGEKQEIKEASDLKHPF